jgi:hypothetical protein
VRVALGIAVALTLALPASAAAQSRTETPVKSIASDAKLVRQSYVRLRDPLPADAGPHPEACDWISLGAGHRSRRGR